MKNIIIGGTKFTTFRKGGETFLCTGNVTGEIKFAWSGEFNDYYSVEGATSVVSGNKSVEDLYEEWLDHTAFYRSIGVKF